MSSALYLNLSLFTHLQCWTLSNKWEQMLFQ